MDKLKQTVRLVLVVSVILGCTSRADDVEELKWDQLVPGGVAFQPVLIPGHGPADDGILPGDDMGMGMGMAGDDMSMGGTDNVSSFVPMQPDYPMGVVEELDGKQVKLPGFVVPIEMADGGKVKEFLLVPYFGACIHYPPPPPNQIVYVVLEEPVELESMYDAVYAVGKLNTTFRRSQLGAAGYTMSAGALEEYKD